MINVLDRWIISDPTSVNILVSLLLLCRKIQANYLIKVCGTCGETAHHGREYGRVEHIMAPRRERNLSIIIKKRSPVIQNLLLGLNSSSFYLLPIALSRGPSLYHLSLWENSLDPIFNSKVMRYATAFVSLFL